MKEQQNVSSSRPFLFAISSGSGHDAWKDRSEKASKAIKKEDDKFNQLSINKMESTQASNGTENEGC